MIATIMTVFAIGVFITFGMVMVVAALLLYWIKK
jgi:hypothetical protein